MFRLPPEAVANFLGQTNVLKACPPQVLGKIAPHLDQREVPKGQPLVQTGAPLATVGFLFSGRASMRLQDNLSGADKALDEVHPGDCFGEIAYCFVGVNPVAVIALEDCNILLLKKEHFDQVLAAVPAAAQALARSVTSRLIKAMLIDQLAGGGGQAGPPMPKGEIRFVEVSSYNLTPALLELIPSRLMLAHRMIPLQMLGNRLVLGMVNPKLDDALVELRRVLNAVEPEVVAISIDDFNATVARHKLDLGDRAPAGRGRDQLRPVYLSENRKDVEKAQVVMGEEVTQLVDRILMEGIDRGASDIHIEAEASGLRVRYRVQGMMLERRELIPVSFAGGITARLKILSELDITERRVPQDGRIAATVGKRDLNFRISTLATCRGEKVVMRILDPADVMRPLEHIFLEPQVLDKVKRAIAAPHGAILVAGPTGSGKSSTLYSLLNQRKTSRPDNNIVTVEDPVEFMFPGLTQTPINPKIGLDYAAALRALMRQDPDVIMVGELRDGASTNIAVEAALTGHLVLSSMHGNTAVAVLQRLGHFGIAPVLMSQALNIIVVQRLAPRLCQNCVREDEVSPAMLENLRRLNLVDPGAAAGPKPAVSATMMDNLRRLRLVDSAGGPMKLPRAPGCEACDRTGRKGRVPVVEVLGVHDEVRALIAAGASPGELLKSAEAAGEFVPFSRYAQMLIARKQLAPSDAVHIVAE